MKKILSFILCGVMCCVFLTGCGNEETNENDVKETDSNEAASEEEVQYHEDNQDLVDVFNVTVKELYDEKTSEGYFNLALYQITRKMDENGIDQYHTVALCDTPFVERPVITGYTSENWTSEASNIENYEGTCTYDTWVFTDYNDGSDYNVLVQDDNDQYYNVTITFEEMEYNGDVKYYPTFVNSTLLK